METESESKLHEPLLQASGEQSTLEQIPVLPYPTPEYVSLLLPDEIAQAVQIYLYTVTSFLHLDSDAFAVASDVTTRQGSQIIEFLKRYVNQRAFGLPTLSSPVLDTKTFVLIFRFVSEGHDISAWVDLPFVLGVVTGWYDSRQADVATLLLRLWRRAMKKMTLEFTNLRNGYTSSFDLIIVDDANDIVPTLTALRYMTTLDNEILQILTDDDENFISILHGHYNIYRAHFSQDERKAILYLCYTLLVSLAYRVSESAGGQVQNKKGKGTLGAPERAFVTGFEKALGEFGRGERMDLFVEDLVNETPFREVMEDWLGQWTGADEPVEGLASFLERLKVEDGQDSEENGASPSENESELYRTSLISQVVDILPNLGEGFVEACLSSYNWDLEKTIAAILSNDLPPSLAIMDQSTPRKPKPKDAVEPIYFGPEYTSSCRRNIFDNDPFDLKQISPSQIHRGRKEHTTATELLNNNRKFMASQKSKILESQWDEYEDEYVDTYDDAEVIPSSRTTNARLRTIRDDVDEETTESEAEEDVERVMYATYKRDPAVFERAARKSKEREALKAEIKLSDEQIEGWKTIAELDPSVLRKLEEKELGAFVQTRLPGTAWRAPTATESDEESRAAGVGRDVGSRGGPSGTTTRGKTEGMGSRGRRGGKGKGRGRGGRGGRGRGVDRGLAKKDRIRAGFRPDA